MLTDVDINNFISFGVLASDGVADITFTVNDRAVFNIAAKGVPMLSVPFSQISGFVQNACHPETITIYYKNTYLPQQFDGVNQRLSTIIVNALNSLLIKRDLFISNWYFTVYKDGGAEKQGKRLWASRFLMIVGCRLFVYRYPITKKRGNANIPLNVIDLTNALIEQRSNTIISITTHRDYEFRFGSEKEVPGWMMELRSASSRGLSLFNEQSYIQVFDSISSSQRNLLRATPTNPPEDPQSDDLSEICSSTSDEDLHHDSLLHPLPSYIGTHSSKNSSKKEEAKPMDDDLMISFYSWGSNSSNQLGILSNQQCYATPTKLLLLSSPQTVPLMIAAGCCHVLCLTDDGELYAWGTGDKGQLGLGPTITECTTPHPIPSLKQTSIMSIACGGNHCVCLSNTGIVYSWGQGVYGQLGQGLDVDTASEPMILHKLRGKDICSIACGQNHSLFLAANGSVYACGNGYYGQLGLEQDIDYFSPVIIKNLLSYTITQIGCGETFSLFVTDHNELLVTGLLEVPECEYDNYKTSLSIPHKVPFDKEIIQIATGTRFALLLVKTKHNNDVYYWKAEENQSGLQKPVLVPFLSTMHITNVACGASHCIAYSTVTGRAFSWGTNYCGELGNGTFDDSLEPREIQIPENEKFIQIVGGNAFTLGLALPLTSSRSKRTTIIDEVKIEEEPSYQPVLPTPKQSSRFTFNTVEITESHEKPRCVNSPLSAMTSTNSVRSSVPFTPMMERKNQEDICFQNRSVRAAALEKQFQAILKH